MTRQDELTYTINQLLTLHYNRATQKWYTDANTKEIEATEPEVKTFQNQIRVLKFGIRMLNEEKVVVDFLDSGVGTEEAYKKVMPLVSRRKHPEVWAKIRKGLPDGSQFTFETTQTKIGVICGCTDHQLMQDQTNNPAIVKWFTQHNLEFSVAELRRIHDGSASEWSKQTINADEITDDRILCMRPKPVYAHQNKHSLGNWDCQACLNSGSEISSGNDADIAYNKRLKALEWCPRFFPILRHLPVLDYLQACKDNSVCYGGLVHSEMSFIERVFLGDKDVTDEEPHTAKTGRSVIKAGQRCDEIMLVENVSKLVTKKYVVIKKRCDTCIYTDEIRKEYVEPEQVREDQVLQVIP